MKIPNGMTEQSVLDTINLVIKRIAPKYTFSGYDIEDIKQEAFIICLSALNRYTDGNPLENFLAVNLSNRLKNLIRDNHYLSTDPDSKKKILAPGQLSSEDHTKYYFENIENTIDFIEISKLIDKYLPVKYRASYLKLINNTPIPKKEKEELIQLIRSIVSDHGYEVEGSTEEIE
jgi:DNA-directed RNA polymerase specialized sigma24 family protein